MNYPEDNEPSMNSEPFPLQPSHAKQPIYEPGDRFVALLDKMTRESYAHLAEADLMRRVASIERRVSNLEYAVSMRER